MTPLLPWQWALLVVGSVFVGMAKTGLAGLGTLFIAIFASVLPTKQATGMVLPLLIFGDCIAVATYRRHAQWPQLLRLFPWAGAGVVAGYFALNRIDNSQARVLVGATILVLLCLHVWSRSRAAALLDRWKEEGPPAPLVIVTGFVAGFTTLVANAAGPLMTLYLLALRLPKLNFLGTTAIYFLLLNLFKVPFMVDLGLIDMSSFKVNLLLAPAVVVGGLAGRRLVHRINQKWFERVTLALTALAGIKLVFF
ncbi:MAG: sulfite exporter TauE/SafE family protein [Opitutaceae bacterium]|nr:sulfite exporter TauE/SafE family protein [Opitutaceae bacterium]